MIVVDVNTTIIPRECRVWRLFPGSSYKFLDVFVENDVGFLDIPGLELPQFDTYSDDEIIARLYASERVKEIIKDAGIQASAQVNWKNHTGRRKTSQKIAIKNALKSFYYAANSGDFVIFPSTLEEKQVYIGTFSRNTTINTSYAPRNYGEQRIPSRRIEWHAVVSEQKLSLDLSKFLRQQSPFSLVKRSHYNEIVSFVHSSFVFNDFHSAQIYNRKDDYLDIDSALMGLISQVSANYSASYDDEASGADSDLLTTILTTPPVQYTCSQSSDIHSEGFSRYVSGKITPIVFKTILGILIFLGQTSSRDALAEDIKKIQIVNSAAGRDDRCSAPVHSITQSFLDTTALDQVWEMCQRALQTHERSGIDPGVSIKKEDQPSQEQQK